MENNNALKQETLELFVTELLHIDDVSKNKLINLYAGDNSKTFCLEKPEYDSRSRYILNVARARIGAPGNTVLRKSSRNPEQEQLIGDDINCVDWSSLDGTKNSDVLHKFIDDTYKEISLKGNNPLFLCVGSLKWKVATADDVQNVTSPLILFPIRLIRTGTYQTPVYIEFVNDDIYINPCLMAKLRQVWGDKLVDNFPHPNGDECHDMDTPIDLEKLDNGVDYFEKVAEYISRQKRDDLTLDTVFEFDRDSAVILQYNHDELCMYYDIKRNKTKIFEHPLIQRIFTKHDSFLPAKPVREEPQCVLPHDSVQEDIIRRVVNGDSLIIKGPPGTGKTLTITNMIASLLASGKKVMLSSQKPAAMSEVYAKLPPELRKFVMMLSSETEAQAAKLNPSDVRKDFNSLLEEKKKFNNPIGSYNDLNAGKSKAKLASKEIENYREIMFSVAEGTDIVGLSYFAALDAYCKIDAEPVKFCEGALAYAMPRDVYHFFATKVGTASNHFDLLGKNHPLEKSPWIPYGFRTLEDVNTEAALAAYEKMGEGVSALLKEATEIFEECGIRGENLPLSVAACILKNKISLEAIRTVIDSKNARAVKNVCDVYRDFVSNRVALPKTLKATEASLELDSLPTEKDVDTALTIAAFLDLYDNWEVCKLATDKVKVKILAEYGKGHSERMKKCKEHEHEFFSIFRKDISDEELDLIKEATIALSGYSVEAKPQKPGVFDFKGKKLYAQINTLGYEPTIPFTDVLTALAHWTEIGKLVEEDKQAKIKVCKLFQIMLTDEQLDILDTLVDYSTDAGVATDEYTARLEKHKDAIREAIKTAEYSGSETLAELFRAIDSAKALHGLTRVLELLNGEEKPLGEITDENTLATAEVVYALANVYESGIFGKAEADMATRIGGFKTNGKTLSLGIEQVQKELEKFGKTFFETYYSHNPMLVTFGDLNYIATEALNRELLHAANEYLIITRKDANAGVDLARFFRPFECGVRSRGEHSFVDLFEHSVLYLAIQEKLRRLEKYRYGLGNRITGELEKLSDGNSLVERAVLLITESICFSRINEADPDFAFLNAEKGINETLRKLFKNHARAIMKLKKCFILSPSTVSVMMRSEVFEDFDVVIIDEASQLEPVSILPVLFRAKQVVMVGDEWQMPPIKHFVTRGDRVVTDEDGSVEILDPDTSVLGLALNNCAFPAMQLCCHYRSRTESLISFSQQRFYDYMRTFPTANPNAKGLGFKDIYVEDGYIEDKKNIPEAKAVVAELKAHFDSYYNEETETLSESVGIVAFGEEQVKEIKRQIAQDLYLGAKIDKAIANFNDLPEKLIFFKTIETVQGQEADHLIISITYGKRANGEISQAFGQLNRGMSEGSKLGLCIFNVAVTRAKSSVAVVHSIKAEQITNQNVAFIGDYLRIVKQFSEGGKSQFVSNTVLKPGFVSRVVEYIVSCGIDRSRIVTDFGVTEGSVRIPIAILSEDFSHAVAGIWCEKNLDASADYLDYNQLYYTELTARRGWKLHRIYIHDWVDNNAAEKESLREFISSAIANDKA